LPSSDDIKRLHSYHASTIAHLLALIHLPDQSFPPPKTQLLVIDDVSTLFPPHYSRKAHSKPATPKATNHSVQLVLLGALGRIASAHNVAVVVLSHVSTRIRHGAGAFLIPSQDTREWDEKFASRIALFRDFASIAAWENAQRHDASEQEVLARLRYAGIVKVHGKSSMDHEGFRDMVPFGIDAVGAACYMYHSTQTLIDYGQRGKPMSTSFAPDQIPASVRSSPMKSRKRPFEQQIPDSDDDWSDSLDEYSWADHEVHGVRADAEQPDRSSKKIKADSNGETEREPGG
jgi:hypothetical protein